MSRNLLLVKPVHDTVLACKKHISLHKNKKAFSPLYHCHPIGCLLHSFSIKNIFMIKWTWGFFIFMWRYIALYQVSMMEIFFTVNWFCQRNKKPWRDTKYTSVMHLFFNWISCKHLVFDAWRYVICLILLLIIYWCHKLQLLH